MKARLLLLLVFLVSVSWLLWSMSGFVNGGHEKSVMVVLGLLISPGTSLASFIMFCFSFAHVTVLEDGSLEYDPSNFYWRCMKEITPPGSWKSSTTLCEIFWMTAFYLATFFFILFFAASILIAIIVGIGNWRDIVRGLIQHSDLIIAIVAFGVLLIMLSVAKGQCELSKTSQRKIIWSGCFWTSLFMVFIGMPTYVAMHFFNKSLIDVVIGYGLVVGSLLAVVVLLIGSWYLFSKIPKKIFQDNILMQFLIAVKKGLCPLLREKQDENRVLNYY